MVIHHQQVKFFLLGILQVADCGKQHAAGLDAHHLSRRKVGDCDQCLADQLFRLVVCVDTAQDRTVCACTVIQRKLKQLLGFLDCLACFYFHCTEVRLAEGVKIDLLFKERLYLYIGEIDLVVRG